MLKFLCLLFLFSVFQVQAENKPLTQKNKPKVQKIQLVTPCYQAYKNGKNSASTGEVISAIETCNEAQIKECQKYTGDTSTGDGRYIAGICGLTSAVAANKAANNSVVVESCSKAQKKAMKSPSTGDLLDAIDICKNETQKICAKLSDGTGDGRLVAANCALDAAYGSYKSAHDLNMSSNTDSTTQEYEVTK